jgi:hypothetical protein
MRCTSSGENSRGDLLLLPCLRWLWQAALHRALRPAAQPLAHCLAARRLPCRVRLGAPVQAQLAGPTTVQHDFGATPFCRVPLLLHLRNTLPKPAAVCIELGRGSDGSATPAGDPAALAAAVCQRPGWMPLLDATRSTEETCLVGAGDATWAALPTQASDVSAAAQCRSSVQGEAPSAMPPCRGYVWVGRTRVTLPQLQPGTTVQVPLEAAVLVPGMAALSDYTVTWTYAELPAYGGSRPGPPFFCNLVA